MQDILRDYKVKGALAFTGRGHVPLRELSDSNYTASLELTDAAIHLPKWDVTVEPVSARFTIAGESKPTPATTPGTEPTTSQGATTAPSTQPARGLALKCAEHVPRRQRRGVARPDRREARDRPGDADVEGH